MEQVCSGDASAVTEAEIESSKVHWSELRSGEVEERDEGEMQRLAASNRAIFKSIMEEWPGSFLFCDWGGDTELGEKIAEGGQAEICALKKHVSALIKVFKLEGLSLCDLQKQWPMSFLQSYMNFKDIKFPTLRAHLLDDGRFAFVMHRQWGDLRRLIDLRMRHNCNQGPPFSNAKAYRIMFGIAETMDWLHKSNILHRDLKAANVLIHVHYIEYKKKRRCDPSRDDDFFCQVADYECSIGVVGTGFWRAPEILRAVKDRSIHDKPELFTESADVYSYAMTCYEVLTGKYPYEGVSRVNYEAYLASRREFKWPEDIDPKVRAMLKRCSRLHPSKRPTFAEIASLWF